MKGIKHISLALLFSVSLPFHAFAQVVTIPSSGYDGLFSISAPDANFSLYDPSNTSVGSSTYCTASTTLMADYDCNISGTFFYGTWIVSQNDATGAPAIYNFLAPTSTAALLAANTIRTGVNLVNTSLPLAGAAGGVLFAAFALLILLWAFIQSTRRARPRG